MGNESLQDDVQQGVKRRRGIHSVVFTRILTCARIVDVI